MFGAILSCGHKFIRGGLLALCLLALAPEVWAKPIKVMQRQDLDFGTVASSVSTGGTVVINASTGAKSVTGGVVDLGGAHGRAEFRVTGDKNTAYTITLPTSITINAATGPGTATIDTFVSDPSSPAVLPNNGQQTVFVGATLTVGANQPPETYSGSFDIIVEYQ